MPGPPPPAPQSPATHNDIFERFVDPDAEDATITVAGMVAYGLYKKDKRQWMMRFCEEKGRAPSAAEIADYMIGWNQARFDSSKTSAQGVLANFAAYFLAQERPKIIKEALRGRFIENLAMGLAVNVTYTAILLVVVIGLGAQGVDLLEMYEKLGAAGAGANSPPAG